MELRIWYVFFVARANRYFTRGMHYHVTHRCHNGGFLLKFARDREMYRSMMRDRLGRYDVRLLGYCITSNHIHSIVTAPNKYGLAKFMQSLAGDFAQAYNIRKKRSGAFWGDRYHACQIEGGKHLWNCLKYVDMNMVRAGAVDHPSQWQWCGYQETAGLRKRYRLIDREALMAALGDGMTMEGFKENYTYCIEEAVSAQEFSREAMWSESLAIGSERFVEEVEKSLKNRARKEVVAADRDRGSFILRESGTQICLEPVLTPEKRL